MAAPFFATNWIAHHTLRPAYSFRSETNKDDNWYRYTYIVNGQTKESYWLNPQGIDRGEPTKSLYVLHALVGHHGVFSLTPIWLLSMAGMLMWLGSPDWSRRELALMAILITVICLVFFIGMRPRKIEIMAA